MTTWASTDDVSTITGTTVTESELAQAGAVIDIYSNRTVTASGGIGERDRGWLRQAVSWQAVWQRGQAGYDTRHGVSRVSQDGVQVDYVAEHNVTLAPLAARALKNLSWKADRSLRVPNVRVPRGADPTLIDYTQERTDDLHPWVPMGWH